MDNEQLETITITLPPEYTGIFAELLYWAENSTPDQMELLIGSLRLLTDTIADEMPNPLE